MEKILTIVIPVYNVEKYLEKCLDSIVQQSGSWDEAVEVLVIDDGSPDHSGEIADAYAKKYTFMRVIHQKNAGVAEARNTGIRAASGQWLLFIDSDDWLAENAISIIIKKCLIEKNANILLFDAYKESLSRQEAWEHFAHETIIKTREKLDLLQAAVLYFPMVNTHIPLAAPWDKVYRKSFLEQYHLLFCRELKVLDDMVFNVMAFGSAREIRYFKDRIYHYRFVPDSITNNYKQDRVEQDEKVWAVLKEYAEQHVTNKELFERALFCRIIKSFSICCRLNFFNEKNPNALRQKCAYVKDVLNREVYQKAFSYVRLSDLEWKLKVMVVLGRMKWTYGIYLLHKGQSFLVKKK